MDRVLVVDGEVVTATRHGRVHPGTAHLLQRHHLADLYRPSHADWTYEAKYGFRDHRGGGRSSARETVGRVAAGAVARALLDAVAGVEVLAWVSQVHGIAAEVDVGADWGDEAVRALVGSGAFAALLTPAEQERISRRLAESTLKETNPLTSHTQVIVGFSPATVYKFWMDCADEGGNTSKSDDFVLITPIKEKNIIDIILENFQGTFGWVNKIGK